MSSSKKTSSSSQEMTIPITFGDMPKMSKSPRPRLMPFAFPNLPDLPEMQISSLPMPSLQMPSMEMPTMQMPSADDMMARMQAQMQAQMASMQQMHSMPMPMMGGMPSMPSMPGKKNLRKYPMPTFW